MIAAAIAFVVGMLVGAGGLFLLGASLGEHSTAEYDGL